MVTKDVTRPVFLPVIVGTPRQGRLTEPAANFVFGEVSKRSDIETELIDIRKIPIRMDDAGEALKDSEFSATGKITDPAYSRRVEKFLNELVWMARALRHARESLPAA